MNGTRTLDIAFVIEQVLGHITHADNLRAHVPNHPDVRPHWVLPAFDMTRTGSRVPFYRSNWTVRAGLSARRALKKINSDSGLDALFFHTQTPAMLCPDWMRRFPTVLSVDATPLQYDQLGAYYEHQIGPAPIEHLKARATKARFAAAERIVTWSGWAKQSLVDDYSIPPERIDVIPPGVTINDWSSPRRSRDPADPVRILFVGGDLERKGGLLLLEAFRSVRHLGATLHVVTRDDVPDEEGVVVHHGIGPNSAELRQLYAHSDIFALPTMGDCLPMVLSEAGAAGLPTISTRVGAIPEVVLDGQTGILTPTGDVRLLGDALRRLIERPDDRRQMGDRASEHIARSYDTATNTSDLVRILVAAAEARHAGGSST